MNKYFSILNRDRCESPQGFNHKLGSWNSSEWMVAILGELGEAANCIKKLNRVRDGIPGNKESSMELIENLESELADTYIYLDLLCQSLNIDLKKAVMKKFEETNKKIGYVTPEEIKSLICGES